MIKIIKYSITLIIFAIITTLFVLYFSLLKGISIENINYKHINIDKLYIKIDKKLIIRAKNISLIKNSKKNTQKQTISTNNKNSDIINVKETARLVEKVMQFLSFFQEIDVTNINIYNNKINYIYLHNNNFKIDTDDIFIQTSLTPQNKKVLFNISTLHIKKYNIVLKNINGEFHSDLLYLYLSIKTTYQNTKFNIDLKANRKKIKYNISIQDITEQTLTIIKDKLKNIDKLSLSSINISGDQKQANINLNSIFIKSNNNIIKTPLVQLKYDLKKQALSIQNSYLNIYNNLNNIEIFQTHIDFNIKNKQGIIYNKNIISTNNHLVTKISLTPIYINNTQINIKNISIINRIIKIELLNNKFSKNDNIISSYTKLIKTSYKNSDYIYLKNLKINFDINKNILKTQIPKLSIADANIDNINILLNKNILNITFKSYSILSKNLIQTLSKMGINLNIYQANGKNNIIGKITYNLNNNKLNTYIKIGINNSKLYLSKSLFLYLHNANLEFKNNKINLINSDLSLKIAIVNLRYFIKQGIIDLDNLKINTYGYFKFLDINNILNIKNYQENLIIDLNSPIKIDLENLATSITIDKNTIIKVNKLSKLYNYIKYLKQYKLEDGNIIITIAKSILIDSKITKTKQNILAYKLKPLRKIDINTTIKDDNISIYNKNIKIDIQNSKNILKVYGKYKNLDINVTPLITTNENNETNSSKKSETNTTINHKTTKQNNTSTNSTININLKAKNTNIIYNDMKIYSSKLNVDFNGSYGIITSLYKDRNITIIYDDSQIKLYGLKIKEKTLKDLTNTTILRHPLITIFAMKNKNSDIIQGFIEIHKGYIKELKIFNNVLAFINLIPSLVTFKPVGFTTKGYKIKHGYIEYIMYNKIIYFKKIKIKGENLTFSGNGYIDLNKNKIKLKVNVNLIVKLVKDIPIVNYILLGKDGGITIKLTIHGKLDNPKISKNTASNIIEAPLGIIKRTILTPFRPFMKKDDE